MSTSIDRDQVTDLAESTGLSEKEIREIIELVGPNRSSIIREATILKRSLAAFGNSMVWKAH
ncbi:MAG: hypothetical protein M9924_08855 [Rhizobiaceae bacterium]|nr:hypothetical protein [Rhizobiaceae bacterium]